jgi:hypothetical protein
VQPREPAVRLVAALVALPGGRVVARQERTLSMSELGPAARELTRDLVAQLLEPPEARPQR